MGGPSFCRGLTHGAAVAFWTTLGGPSFCRSSSPHSAVPFWTSPCPLLKGGGSGLLDTAGGLFLSVSPGFSMGNRLPGPNRITLKPISSPTQFRLPRGKSRPRYNSPPLGGGRGWSPRVPANSQVYSRQNGCKQGVVAAHSRRLPSPFPPKRMHLRGGPPPRGSAASPPPCPLF